MTETQQTAIIYQNPSKTITVLDLPLSIAHGQNSSAHLTSSAAPEIPYPSTEPKGPKRAKLLNTVPEVERHYHHGILEILQRALREARDGIGDGDWCWAREEQPKVSETARFALADFARSSPAVQPPLILSQFDNDMADFNVLQKSLVVNPLHFPTLVVVGFDAFYVPSRSSFLCSTIADGMPAFQYAMKSGNLSADSKGCNRSFDFVLLDPPWSNRSVRNAQSYRTAETQYDDPFDEVLPILRSQVTLNGIIAIWITNKAAVRNRVLLAMKNMSFVPFEEWMWLKVTKKGDPVTEIDGLWRKPYEVLLCFSRSSAPPSDIQRRVLIAVPDLHSRKPCLKSLIEPLLPQTYCALEIFARSLTVGWTSWGDECLKFQHSSFWTPSPLRRGEYPSCFPHSGAKH